MATEYGVGITNRYAFLVDDVEELEEAVLLNASDKKKKDEVKTATATLAKKGGPVTKDKVIKGTKSTSAIETSKDLDRDNVNVSSSGRRGGGRGGSSTRGNSSRGRGGGRSGDNSLLDLEGGGEGYEGIGRGGGSGNKENYDNSGRRGGRGGGGRGRGNGNNSSRNAYDNNGGEFGSYSDDQGFQESKGGSGREYSGRGRGGRGGSGGGGRGGRRDYDRQSGSDKSSVKPMDKRDGGGAHNWGTYKDDEFKSDSGNDDEKQFNEDGNVDEFKEGNGSVGDETEKTGEESAGGEQEKISSLVEVEVELEPKTLTLDEWKAMQQPRATPQFNIRKPNDGEDPTKWKNLVLKKKNKLDDEEEYEEGEDIWVPQRAGRLQRITDIGFHFEDDRPNDRGFRRGQKQFRARDNDRKDRQFGRIRERVPMPPRVDDERDFPTL